LTAHAAKEIEDEQMDMAWLLSNMCLNSY
jgi:hypothetical protein